jgi:hypothetical protein
MKQEDKELLIKDLCGRLTYGVKVRYSSYYEFITCTLDTVTPKYKCVDLWSKNACFTSIFVDKIKPYLFPLSSMTDEQKEELKQRGWYFDCFEIYNVDKHGWREAISHEDCFDLIDWLNKNHFDYRGLIEKSLAIDATNLNIY